MNRTPLCQIFNQYRADKSPDVFHTYSPVYYEILNPIRDTAQHVLEIGIGTVPLMEQVTGPGYIPGASIRGWRDFFPQAHIYAWDIQPEVMFTDTRISTHLVDQSSVDEIRQFIRLAGVKFDFIIDDGSHFTEHQIISAYELQHSLKPGGIYIIEDVQLQNLNTMVDIQYPGMDLLLYHIGDRDNWDNFICYKKPL